MHAASGQRSEAFIAPIRVQPVQFVEYLLAVDFAHVRLPGPPSRSAMPRQEPVPLAPCHDEIDATVRQRGKPDDRLSWILMIKNSEHGRCHGIVGPRLAHRSFSHQSPPTIVAVPGTSIGWLSTFVQSPNAQITA